VPMCTAETVGGVKGPRNRRLPVRGPPGQAVATASARGGAAAEFRGGPRVPEGFAVRRTWEHPSGCHQTPSLRGPGMNNVNGQGTDMDKANPPGHLDNILRSIDDILQFTCKGTAAVTGGELLRARVRAIASAMKVRWALVSELAHTRERVRTLAFCLKHFFAMLASWRDHWDWNSQGALPRHLAGRRVLQQPTDQRRKN